MNEKNKIISFNSKIFAFSFWMIFFTFEGSFSIQCLLPFLILIIVYELIFKKDKTLKINKESKILAFFILAIILSTTISFFINNQYFNINSIIEVLYFIIIFLWYLFNTNTKYNSKEINYILSSYIWMSLFCSCLLIFRYYSGQIGKIAMINLINVEIDENYISALISMATLFTFNRIINKKTTLKSKIVYLIIFCINALAIALSGSRASLLSTLIAIILAIIMTFFKDMTFKKIFKILIIILLSIFTGIKIFNYIPTWTFNRYFNSSYKDNSNISRFLMWKNGIKGFINSPIYGYGIKVFDKIPEYSTINGIKIPERVPAHQTYIDLLLYSGLLGFLPFITFMILIFSRFLKKQKKIYLPMILIFILITNILGAEHSVFMWNSLIIFTIVGNYLKDHDNIENII